MHGGWKVLTEDVDFRLKQWIEIDAPSITFWETMGDWGDQRYKLNYKRRPRCHNQNHQKTTKNTKRDKAWANAEAKWGEILGGPMGTGPTSRIPLCFGLLSFSGGQQTHEGVPSGVGTNPWLPMQGRSGKCLHPTEVLRCFDADIM